MSFWREKNSPVSKLLKKLHECKFGGWNWEFMKPKPKQLIKITLKAVAENDIRKVEIAEKLF